MTTPTNGARGASLAGVLVIVVVLGGLAATAVIGVNAMTGNDAAFSGLTTTSTRGGPDSGGLGGLVGVGAAAACHATAGAADAASTAYFVSGGARTYPTRWSQLTGGATPFYALPAGVVVNPSKPRELDGKGWKLIMAGNGTTAPIFTCR